MGFKSAPLWLKYGSIAVLVYIIVLALFYGAFSVGFIPVVAIIFAFLILPGLGFMVLWEFFNLPQSGIYEYVFKALFVLVCCAVVFGLAAAEGYDKSKKLKEKSYGSVKQ